MPLTDTVNEDELQLKLRKLRMCLEETMLDVDSRTGLQAVDTSHSGEAGNAGSPYAKHALEQQQQRQKEEEKAVEEGKMRQLLRKLSNQWTMYWFPQGACLVLYVILRQCPNAAYTIDLTAYNDFRVVDVQ